MDNTYIVTGTLTDERTVTLDESLPLTRMKVRLVVSLLTEPSRRSYQEVISEIRERQKARGHKSPTREEVDHYLSNERDSWEK